MAQSRRVGNRLWELSFLGQLYSFVAAGEWDEALAMFAELPIDEWEQTRVAFGVVPLVLATVGVNRGTVADTQPVVERFQAMEASADIQEQSTYCSAHSRLALAQGDFELALTLAERAFSAHASLGVAAEQVKEGFVDRR